MVAAQRLHKTVVAAHGSMAVPDLLQCFQSYRRALSSLRDGPDLQDFLLQSAQGKAGTGSQPCSTTEPMYSAKPSVFIKTYGCQMNVSDTELVRSILTNAGFTMTDEESKAKVVLLNTCAIRDAAEQKVWGKVHTLHQQPGISGEKRTVGILGCMAERLKDRLLESQLVQIVAGPDSYRDLPRLLDMVSSGGQNAINVQLSVDETYADIAPVRAAGAYSAFISIMRGCANLCSFCIVPYVRGVERSRPMASILDEVQRLSEIGVREVTLLGQNVNSYSDFSSTAVKPPRAAASAEKWYASGFQTVYKPNRQGAVVFSELLDKVAQVDPNMRIRFTSPHPKDFNDATLEVVAKHHNICKHLHMPAQSGSTEVLERMRRGYTRIAYDALLARTAEIVPGATFSTDIITGFCGESEEDHKQTLDLLEKHQFSTGFLFAYSDRERTHAARHYVDDVPPEVKKRRLAEALAVFKAGVTAKRRALLGTRQLVLVEGTSKKGAGLLFGRTEGFQSVQIPCVEMLDLTAPGNLRLPATGDFVDVDIEEAENGRLEGRPRQICNLTRFFASSGTPVILQGTTPPAAVKAPLQPELQQNVMDASG